MIFETKSTCGRQSEENDYTFSKIKRNVGKTNGTQNMLPRPPVKCIQNGVKFEHEMKADHKRHFKKHNGGRNIFNLGELKKKKTKIHT